MLEVYRNSSEYIVHTVYFGGAPTEVDNNEISVELKDSTTGQVYYAGEAEDLNLGRYRVRIPATATKFDGTLKSYWSYSIDGEPLVGEEIIEVVTPYVSVDEITTAYPQLADKSYEEVREMERKVRLIINQITGQDFGIKRLALPVTSTSMTLPHRLYDVSHFTMNGNVIQEIDWSVGNDGYLLTVTFPTSYYSVKSDTWYRARSPKYSTVLHGVFGWQTVPNDINLAARLLIGDYFCGDALYRARGVQAVRAADWRLDFHDKAFEGTGNLDVDALLRKYAIYNMVII